MAGTKTSPDTGENESAETCEVLLLRPPSSKPGEAVAAAESVFQEEYAQRRVFVERGLTLLEAARIAGFSHRYRVRWVSGSAHDAGPFRLPYR